MHPPPTPKRNLHVYLLPLFSFYFSIKTLSVFLLSPGIIFLVLFHLMAPLSEKYSGGGGVTAYSNRTCSKIIYFTWVWKEFGGEGKILTPDNLFWDP